jgi:hypothetical protein
MPDDDGYREGDLYYFKDGAWRSLTGPVASGVAAVCYWSLEPTGSEQFSDGCACGGGGGGVRRSLPSTVARAVRAVAVQRVTAPGRGTSVRALRW